MMNRVLAAAGNQPVYDFGIESLKSHEYSVGIFIFMMISIVLFGGIMVVFMKSPKGDSMKKGEWAMMIAIFLGLIGGAIFAALQLLEGYLF